ncbi:MAG: hypothetical protein ACOX0M_09440 [Salinivirgaceae bacterium]|jgi:hypothetical protein|nr:hypothetical protein [Bacteroidales bacterium]
MKVFRLLLGSLLLLGVATLSGCKKEKEEVKVDKRDQYVGTWNYTQTGSMTLYHNGEAVYTVPMDGSGTMSITKSGENDLIIDGVKFTVNGNNLTAPTQSLTDASDGFNYVATITTDNGTLAPNVITINNSITGTWNNSDGDTGNLSGTLTTILTK